MTTLTKTARSISGIGLGAVGAVHALWATGSHWPARSRGRLAEAVVGNADALPGPRACAVVAGAAVLAGGVAAGIGGEARLAVRARRLTGVALLARGALGGDVALAVLGLPPAKQRFRDLDNRWYRPLCGVLGLAALVGARSRRAARD
ncbi:DUF3995 domain-containing protein [Leucobacter luti]|uniref:Uncharacterized protein DUF3995 n=1 Tax=Leucobacter luti TaxID=340320 RepID=A0A4Q7TXT9_9MICO|nr:DUF3995 domain-containing protein [Leucobacter luti]MBL3698660.1 DUF3995 domain-containing protein [Leucobacter luti]RZT66034.1 uncharacterized protein DUF3995 [Leucobacter luti]